MQLPTLSSLVMKKFKNSTISLVSAATNSNLMIEHFPKPYTKAEARMLVAEENNKEEEVD